MKGDRVEAVVDTGQGTQTFVIEATRNGRRLEVTTSRALVEHPAHEGRDSLVDVETRRRLTSSADA